ncbi:MAG: hypothetical protein DHS20C12_20110 [Pseudohongiella sp.]|nr:MAG: hypothetical protein DHS20C12_20110 [Pseudohongiella sp.]
MSDEFEEIVDNIREPSVWIRILFMIAFSLAAYFVLLPLIIVLSIAQALFTLITGQSNANLRYFSATLGLYVTQVIEFLTYLSEVKPYPFSDLPEVEDNSLQEESTPKKKSSAAAKKPAAKKKAVKKKAAKKKAAKKKAASNTAKDESDAGSEDKDNS